LRALSIQAADIGLAFGTIGIFAGVAAGALIPLVSGFFNLERDTRDVSERVDDLSGAFKGLRDAQDLAGASVEVLIERYGRMDTQIRRVVDGLREVSLSQFRNQVESAVAGFSEMESDVGTAIDALQRLETSSGRNLRAVETAFGSLSPSVREAASAVMNFATSGQEELSVQRDRALDAADALEALNDPTYDAAIAELFRFADIASQQLGRVVNDAGAAANAIALLNSGAVGPDAARFAGMDARAESVVAQRSYTSSVRSGGGGGGGSGAREITAEMRAADQAIRRAQEAAVQFGDVQAVLNERLAAGSINLETYNSALEMARDRYTQVGEAAQFWDQQAQTLKDGILDAIVAGDDLSETFANLAKSIARAALEAALFGSGPFGGSVGGTGLLSSAFSGIFGGARAEGGPVSQGKAYLVGERGPEIFAPSSSGRVIPNDKISGGNVTISIDARGAQMGVAEQIGMEIQRRLPQITAAVQASSVTDRSRGRVA